MRGNFTYLCILLQMCRCGYVCMHSICATRYQLRFPALLETCHRAVAGHAHVWLAPRHCHTQCCARGSGRKAVQNSINKAKSGEAIEQASKVSRLGLQIAGSATALVFRITTTLTTHGMSVQHHNTCLNTRFVACGQSRLWCTALDL